MTTRRVMLPLMRESCMAALRAEFEAHARRLLGATSASMLSPMPVHLGVKVQHPRPTRCGQPPLRLRLRLAAPGLAWVEGSGRRVQG